MKALGSLSNAQLEAIAKQGPLTTGQQIGRFFSPFPTPDLERRSEAAQLLLAQRAAAAQQVQPQAPAPLPSPDQIAGAVEALAILVAARRLDAAAAAPGAGQLDPLAPVPLVGSIQVGLVPALTGNAIRQKMSAKGINAELVTERIDP